MIYKKLKYIVLFLCVLLPFVSFSNKSQTATNEPKLIDNIVSTFPIEHETRLFTPGIVDDTISFKVMFDTGASELSLPKNLKSSLSDSNAVKLKIENFEQVFRKIYFMEDEGYAILGWEPFRNKVVEISYKDKYINILNRLPNTEGYKSVDFTAKDHYLLVPITVNVKGKTFTINDVIIDTGLNEALVISQKEVPDLNYKGANKGIAYTMYGKEDLFVFDSGSVTLGEDRVNNLKITVGSLKAFERTTPINGAIGNRFFKNFSVILDFKNQKMYLKPLSKKA